MSALPARERGELGVGSSGDLLADRRYAYAEALAAEGDDRAAEDLFGQATEIAPKWAAAHLARGFALERLGAADRALAAFARAASCDPTDMLGASLHRDRLRGHTPPSMPSTYVAALFDQYAPRFDAHLVDDLGYRGPEVIREALAGVMPECGDAAALDLGCGTGLMARALGRPGLVCDGVDLSGAMVRLSQATGLYRHVWQGDCTAVLNGRSDACYDLIVAADVLVYFGDLRPLFREVSRVLTAEGLFAATVQAGDGVGFSLGDDLRYRHGADYVDARLDEAGLTRLRLAPCVTRRERDADVPGLVFTARRA